MLKLVFSIKMNLIDSFLLHMDRFMSHKKKFDIIFGLSIIMYLVQIF